jgi:quercetin dioxygenase-like cupin family protein
MRSLLKNPPLSKLSPMIRQFTYALILAACACLGSAQPAQAAEDVDVSVLAKSTKSWDGSTLPAWPKGQSQVTILRIRIQPGVRLPLHSHPVINAGVLISGSLTVTTESGDKLYLKAGDPIIEVVNKWHYGANEGSEVADIIVFYAGVEDSKLSIGKE